MITENMTIHQALTELKTLDKRIIDRIADAEFVRANKHCNSKIAGKSIPEYQNEVKASFQSINNLIARRAAIRNALAESNAKTIITVVGKDYTVSTAIEMKQHGIELKHMLLDKLVRQFTRAKADIESYNGDRLASTADIYVQNLYGAKDKSNADDIAAARDQYIKANTYDLIDPIDAAKQIEALRDEIDAFIAEIDSKISVSNALTTIDIVY